MLGRKVASYQDVGRKKDKKVGIFYWTWHEHQTHKTPQSVQKTLEKYPAAEYNINHPAWKDNRQCFWDEPLFGYYKNSDPYVLRKHAVLLANAGIDFIVFDCTNGTCLWKDAYEPLLEEFKRAREDGIKTPQIAFMLNLFPAEELTYPMLRGIYQDLYKPGRYRDLWFMLDGKPLIMAYPEYIPQEGSGEHDTKFLNELRGFFTFRPGQPLYKGGPKRKDHWGWLEIFPQNKYGVRSDGSCEMVTVGVAQNANDELICTYFNNRKTYGRSYTGRYGHKLLSEDSYLYGYNFQEQWDRAMDLDPDIIFITGWNEWIMGQFKEPWVKDPHSTQIAFVDQFDKEHSRDIEMDRDGYKDTYYLQMVSNIRRFKGAGQPVPPSPPKTIDIQGGFDQWEDVTTEFRNNKGTTLHRDYPGFKGYHYVNRTGRNDIVKAKVTHDKDMIYFYVETSKALSPSTDPNWMNLFIDTDRSKSTGWEGYDFAVNRLSPQEGKAGIEKHLQGFEWETVGQADIRIGERSLHIVVPKKILGLGQDFDIEFKWLDNMQKPDVMDFYENGDAAPTGRFNYRYNTFYGKF
ncbi:MAG TPA: hypothetical protein GXZ29_08620 [Clostridiales bacterium]|nr:hypothetical protein [Clostridiales bacterium]